MRVLAGDRERAADVLLAIVANISAVDRHAALLRIEKAKEQIHDGGLPGTARADDRDAPAWIETKIESSSAGCSPGA